MNDGRGDDNRPNLLLAVLTSRYMIWIDTARATNASIARFKHSRYLVRESKVLIENKTLIASRMVDNQ